MGRSRSATVDLPTPAPRYNTWYKTEVCFVGRVDPFARVGALDDAVLGRLVERARTLLLANRAAVARVTTGPAGSSGAAAGWQPAARSRGERLWVYGRAGRPCRRCGARIRARRHGQLPRTTYWCPVCQPGGEEGPGG